MHYRVFVVEDDPGIAEGVVSACGTWSLEARCCTDFRKVMEEFTAFAPQLVLMDIGLPSMNGYHWCREIRSVSSVPVIFISSASDSMNIVMAMNMGGDDFIAKPFDPDVLIAKIQALLRRCYDYAPSSPVFSHRGVFLNTGDNTLTFNGERISLTRNEYRILLTLMECKGKTVSRERLMEKLWESEEFIDDNTLTVNINRLRKKLEAAGIPPLIQTRVGTGYILE